MTTPPSASSRPDTDSLPPGRDRRRLRRLVRRLDHIRPRHLDDAICDIIDLKGFSVLELLLGLPRLSASTALRVARKIEDFLFFHPNAGKNLLTRLVSAVKSAPQCRPHLIAAIADIIARADQDGRADRSSAAVADIARTLAPEALNLLNTDTDLPRKGKAVELLALSEYYQAVPAILHVLGETLHGLDEYARFSFAETCLFALKRLGGEPLLRLLINPTSVQAAQYLRMHWRERDPEWVRTIQRAVHEFPEDFPQLMLKIVELAEFNLPFATMIQEGLSHKDRWIRQAAAASMARMTTADGFEHLQRMLEDPAEEVRLMAVTSLGNYSQEDTGEKLVDLALNEKESGHIRLNAVYALFAQKNLGGLARVMQSPDRNISLNAQGVAALLTAREDGLKALLNMIDKTVAELIPELFRYIHELARPEDLPILLDKQDTLAKTNKGQAFIGFLTAFLQHQAGPALTAQMEKLDHNRRLAIENLLDLDHPPKPN